MAVGMGYGQADGERGLRLSDRRCRVFSGTLFAPANLFALLEVERQHKSYIGAFAANAASGWPLKEKYARNIRRAKAGCTQMIGPALWAIHIVPHPLLRRSRTTGGMSLKYHMWEPFRSAQCTPVVSEAGVRAGANGMR